MKLRNAISLAVLLMAGVSAAGCGSEAIDPHARQAFTVAVHLADDGRTLKAVSYGEAIAINVDVTGLSVDIDCARQLTFDYPQEVRVELLSAGCAELTNARPISGELKAQESAKSDGAGRWSSSIWTKAGQAWEDTAAWLGRNWRDILTVLGVILGVLGLSWVVKYIDKIRLRRFEKHVHIVLVGAAGAGKTDLWIAWKKDSAPNSDSRPTAGVKKSEGLASVPYGEYTLYPSVIDTAGAEPWQLREQLSEAHRKAKRVLVVVVSPCAENKKVGNRSVDPAYVAEQKGYMNLPRAELGGNNADIRPHLVIMFATKFDLLSDVDPADSNGAVSRALIEKEFDSHRRLIEGQCKKTNTRFVWIIGSSKTGWGISKIRESIREVMPT